jgi:acyl-CoA synthetase (AMP-forming)/AMP-acid ligase II
MFIDPTTNESTTYYQAKQDTELLATALHRAGVSKGDVITTITMNCIQFPILVWACSMLGGIVSPCNPIYSAEEFAKQLTDSQAKYIFHHSKLTPTVQQSIKLYRGEIKQTWVFDGTSERSYRALIKSTKGKADIPKVSINPKKDLLLLPYSSGTTGLPKVS